MVVFDQLRISNDSRKMVIDVHVNQLSYYDNMYISSITLCTEKVVSELNSAVVPSDYLYRIEYDDHPRSVSLTLTKAVMDNAFIHTNNGSALSGHETATVSFSTSDFRSHLFFVYVELGGIPAANTPCDMDKSIYVGVTFDYGTLYGQAMNFTRELAADCTVPRGFIDFILNLEGLKMAIDTDHYVPAVQFWKRLYTGIRMISATGNVGEVRPLTTPKSCGCHG